MRLGDIIAFRKDLYFEGAVQADWFYDREKAALVAENFVFHGKNYFGVEAKKDSIDTVGFVKALANKICKEAKAKIRTVSKYTEQVFRMYGGRTEKVTLLFDKKLIGAIFFFGVGALVIVLFNVGNGLFTTTTP